MVCDISFSHAMYPTGDDPIMSRMYIGCYRDQNIYSAELRDIDEFINQGDYWKDVTLPKCLGACATLGYTIGAIAVSVNNMRDENVFQFLNLSSVNWTRFTIY